MVLHQLSFAEGPPPRLSPDDPDATVWPGPEGPLAVAQRVGEWCHVALAGLASYSFPVVSEDRSVRCVARPQAGVEAGLVVDAYYRTVVPLALQVYGLESMHGAAVDRGGRALVLCGASGTGKSTLARALAARGAAVLADDGLVVEVIGGPEPAALLHPLPFALMLREPSAAHFGERARARAPVGADEAGAGAASSGPASAGADGAGPRGAGPAETAPPVPLAAVVLLERVAAGGPRLSRLEPAEAFTGLLAHAYSFSLAGKGRNRRMVAAYLDLAKAVPVHRLRYPSGLERLEEVARLLAEFA